MSATRSTRKPSPHVIIARFNARLIGVALFFAVFILPWIGGR